MISWAEVDEQQRIFFLGELKAKGIYSETQAHFKNIQSHPNAN